MTMFCIIFICVVSFGIGYMRGFNKCKKIDDSIIEELTREKRKKIEKML